MIDNIFGSSEADFWGKLTNLLTTYAKLSGSKIVFNHVDIEVQYTLKELQLMRLVRDFPRMKNIDVAENLGVTKGMISKMIKTLEERRVIKKQVNPENNREIQLEITDLGRSHLISFSSMTLTTVAEITQEWLSVPQDHRDTLILIIKKYTELLTNLNS
ncbi:MAG: MarR family winged helix-turn-helix transcriptional regulator [Candidatus Kariarchaeaceae archaeon]|jgi:DNA-binding MarR family transcriptional regulator